MNKGCKILVIIGLVLAAILVTGLILSVVFCDKISSALIEKSTDFLQAEVLKNLPEGYQVDDIKARFTEFKQALKGGALKDPARATQLSQFAKDIEKAMADKKIDKEELDRILQLMKEIVGKS